MKDLFKKIYFFSLLLVLITLPFPRGANNYAIILMCSSWILSGGYEDIKYIKKNIPGIFALFLFLFFVIGLFYSEDRGTALKILQSAAPLLIFPIALNSTGALNKKFSQILQWGFVISVLLSSVICLLVAILRTVRYGLYFTDPRDSVVINNFDYYRLSSTVGVHPAFLSLFAGFALIIVFHSLITEKHKRKFAIIKSCLIIFLAGIIILLKTGMASLALIISLVVVIFFVFFSNKTKAKTISLIFFAVSLVLVAIFGVSLKVDLSEKFYNYDITVMPPDPGWNAINLRFALWNTGVKATFDNLPWGVGTGDGVNSLIQYYEESGFEFARYARLHSHNEFIFTSLMIGIPGLLSLSLLLGFGFIRSIRQKNLLYLCLVIMLTGFCLTDIPLERNKTCVFSMFFLNFFEYAWIGMQARSKDQD